MGMADSDDINTAVDFLKTISKEFAITRGAKGALIYDGNELLEIDAIPIKAIDTVGAGDMFAGAMLYGLTQGWSHRRAALLAASAAAKLVTSLGPRLSTATTQAILQAHTTQFI